MLSGTTPSALAMAGTAVFKMVVSSDSMKKATATSQGSKFFTDLPGTAECAESALGFTEVMLMTDGIASLRDTAYHAGDLNACNFRL